MYKVFSFKAVFESGIQLFEENNCQVTVSGGTTRQDFIRELAQGDYDVLFTRTDRIDKEIIDLCPNLKVIAKQGVGLDNVDLDYADEKGIPVVYSPRESGNAVSEHVMFLMMGAVRRFTYIDRNFKEGNFDIRFTLRGVGELRGLTLGLLGCGNIGQQVARKAANGFDMKVVGFDPYARPERINAPITLLGSRDALLAQADVLSIHTPLTPETRGSIGLTDFKKMKDGAILINASRGEVVNEAELIFALQNGILAGAGLDVFAQEPLPMDSLLRTMDNVFLTPHAAATTERAIYDATIVTARGVIEALTNQPITWPGNRVARKRCAKLS